MAKVRATVCLLTSLIKTQKRIQGVDECVNKRKRCEGLKILRIEARNKRASMFRIYIL